ncbi:hypothetical protein TNCV_585991 [Trichonephila clavipes]|nr:hypothetical protein TNCV_585991 [Trichonephila clavipes]
MTLRLRAHDLNYWATAASSAPEDASCRGVDAGTRVFEKKTYTSEKQTIHTKAGKESKQRCIFCTVLNGTVKSHKHRPRIFTSHSHSVYAKRLIPLPSNLNEYSRFSSRVGWKELSLWPQRNPRGKLVEIAMSPS